MAKYFVYGTIIGLLTLVLMNQAMQNIDARLQTKIIYERCAQQTGGGA